MVATAADPFIGRRFGNVRLTARLGAGAMGVVYRGYHERFDREVAVKLLVSKREDKPSYRERFLREGRAAALVRHEHVVQVLDAGQEDNIAYLVMELVNGLSLGSILDEAKVLAPDAVQRLGVGIALGLAAIHAKGILHRDIKPDNILVGTDKKAKIADLGLAKQMDESEENRLTATGVVVGTPLYVSPEAIRDPQHIDAKADIYSLGASLYHMLTGRPPFEGSTPFEVMHGHLDGRVVPIRKLKPEVPEALADLVECCLAKEPSARPTAVELADLLAQGGRRRKRTPVLLLAIAGVALLLVAGGAATLLHRPAAPADPAAGPLADPATSGRIRLLAEAGPLRARIDGGDWQPVPAEGLPAAVGRRRIEVEADPGGPLLRGTVESEVAAGATMEAKVALAPVPIAEVRVPVPGSGMIWVDGTAYAWRENHVALSAAGRYAVARWDGTTWQNATVAIDAAGTLTAPQWSTGGLPLREAFWRARDARGRALPPHHMVSWWEAEQARQATQLPPSVGWMAQGARGEEPPDGLDIPLVQACLKLLAPFEGRLPDRDQALSLATVLQSAVYCQDGAIITRVGGFGGPAAQLVLVPAR